SNLDAKLRVQMRAEIALIQNRLQVTTIYVTHDQTEAMTLGDRVAVLRKGVLQQVAPPQELYDHPVNLFVAGFIGSPALNMAEATGSDVYAHFRIDAPAVVTEETKELAEDVEVETGGRPAFVARFNPRTAAAVSHTVEVAVDTTRLHFFDLETGLAITKETA